MNRTAGRFPERLDPVEVWPCLLGTLASELLQMLSLWMEENGSLESSPCSSESLILCAR